MEINVPVDYGYVLLVICMTWFLLNWLESRSFQARRRYEVPVGDPGKIAVHSCSVLFSDLQASAL